MKGFIPIKRALFKHFLFKERRVFSRFEAWLDLIQLASFTDGQTEIINGKTLTRNRGEIIASLRWLATRWSWSMHKVIDFLEVLRSHDMAVVDKENGISKILLVNFERHNMAGNEDDEKPANSKRSSKRNTQPNDSESIVENSGTLKGTAKGAIEEQRGETEGTNYNNSEEFKKEKKVEGGGADAPCPPAVKLKEKQEEFKKRQKEFYDTLVPYLSVYKKEMLRGFFNYWSEPNKSRTKMKWEMQETWDLKGRLVTWEKNDFKFKGKNDPDTAKNTTVGTPSKSFQEELNFLIGRYKEGELDLRLIKPDLYDKLVSRNSIPVGQLKDLPGGSIDEQKVNGVIEFFKTQTKRHEQAQQN